MSIIEHATNGAAVVSKAAGNDAVTIGSANAAGKASFWPLRGRTRLPAITPLYTAGARPALRARWRPPQSSKNELDQLSGSSRTSLGHKPVFFFLGAARLASGSSGFVELF